MYSISFLILELLKTESEPSLSGEVDNATEEINSKPKKPTHKYKLHQILHCELCDMKTLLKSSLARHMKHKHSKNEHMYRCTICNMVFDNEHAHTEHNNRLHSAPIVCEYCYKTFKAKKNLTFHLLSHRNEHKYKCHICNKTFMQKHVYEGHVNKHSDIRPHKCPLCEESFSYRTCFTRHVETCTQKCTGKAQHLCEFCSDTFSRKDSLAGHISAQHSTQKSQYLCGICGKEYKYRSSLTQHQKKAGH